MLGLIGSVTLGASVLLTGLLERSRGSGQEMELSVKHSTVLGICDPLVRRHLSQVELH
jgi:aspartyl/asparaginyl-tRNA synthetase